MVDPLPAASTAADQPLWATRPAAARDTRGYIRTENLLHRFFFHLWGPNFADAT